MAEDLDVGTNSDLVYMLVHADSFPFEIDKYNGNILTSATLDSDYSPYTFAVRAVDGELRHITLELSMFDTSINMSFWSFIQDKLISVLTEMHIVIARINFI